MLQPEVGCEDVRSAAVSELSYRGPCKDKTLLDGGTLAQRYEHPFREVTGSNPVCTIESPKFGGVQFRWLKHNT